MLYHEIDVTENSVCPRGEFRHCPHTFLPSPTVFQCALHLGLRRVRSPHGSCPHTPTLLLWFLTDRSGLAFFCSGCTTLWYCLHKGGNNSFILHIQHLWSWAGAEVLRPVLTALQSLQICYGASHSHEKGAYLPSPECFTASKRGTAQKWGKFPCKWWLRHLRIEP